MSEEEKPVEGVSRPSEEAAGCSRGARRPGHVALHGMLGESSDWEFLPDVSGIDLWERDCALDEIKIDADVIVGYSMGGRLALHALDQVEAAVIVSAHTGLREGRQDRLDQDLRWAEKCRTMDWAEFLAEWHRQPVFAGGGFEPDRSGLVSRRKEIASAFERWSLGRQRTCCGPSRACRSRFCG